MYILWFGSNVINSLETTSWHAIVIPYTGAVLRQTEKKTYRHPIQSNKVRLQLFDNLIKELRYFYEWELFQYFSLHRNKKKESTAILMICCLLPICRNLSAATNAFNDNFKHSNQTNWKLIIFLFGDLRLR